MNAFRISAQRRGDGEQKEKSKHGLCSRFNNAAHCAHADTPTKKKFCGIFKNI
jgi:hypothetical protein